MIQERGAITWGTQRARWVLLATVLGSSIAFLDATAVLAHFEGRIARFKRPKAVVVVEALPRTALGKVATGALKAIVGKG